MNTKELMIGDLVFYNKPYKVEAINVLGDVLVGGHTHHAREGYIHPIKLSRGMLLDNCFISYCDDVVGIPAIGLELTWDTDRWFANWGNIQIRYVHELQHLLRLVGLRYLANDFKVE